MYIHVYIAKKVIKCLHGIFILLVLQIKCNNVLAFENDGAVVVQIERRGPLYSTITQVVTVDETAIGIIMFYIYISVVYSYMEIFLLQLV